MTAAQASSSQASSAVGPVVCHHCGTTDQPGLTWMRDVDPRRGPIWFCPQCARRNLRAIEAKLDQPYW